MADTLRRSTGTKGYAASSCNRYITPQDFELAHNTGPQPQRCPVRGLWSNTGTKRQSRRAQAARNTWVTRRSLPTETTDTEVSSQILIRCWRLLMTRITRSPLGHDCESKLRKIWMYSAVWSTMNHH